MHEQMNTWTTGTQQPSQSKQKQDLKKITTSKRGTRRFILYTASQKGGKL